MQMIDIPPQIMVFLWEVFDDEAAINRARKQVLEQSQATFVWRSPNFKRLYVGYQAEPVPLDVEEARRLSPLCTKDLENSLFWWCREEMPHVGGAWQRPPVIAPYDPEWVDCTQPTAVLWTPPPRPDPDRIRPTNARITLAAGPPAIRTIQANQIINLESYVFGDDIDPEAGEDPAGVRQKKARTFLDRL